MIGKRLKARDILWLKLVSLYGLYRLENAVTLGLLLILKEFFYMRKDDQVNIRLKYEDKLKFQETARLQGMTLSEWLLKLAFTDVKKHEK